MVKNPYELLEAHIEAIIEEKINELLLRITKESDEKNEKKPIEKQQNEYLSVDELAELTGLKKATIYAKRTRREIPAYKFGRELRFKRSEVEAWINGKRLTCFHSTSERRSA